MCLAAPGLGCGMQALGCDTWDLVTWTGIEPGTPTVRAWSPSHWTTREVL